MSDSSTRTAVLPYTQISRTNILLAIESAFSGSHPISIHKQKTPTLSREGCLFGGAKLGRSRPSMASAADQHPVGHRTRFSGSHPISTHKQKTPTLSREGCLFGGAKRDRTADLNTASEVLDYTRLRHGAKVRIIAQS